MFKCFFGGEVEMFKGSSLFVYLIVYLFIYLVECIFFFSFVLFFVFFSLFVLFGLFDFRVPVTEHHILTVLTELSDTFGVPDVGAVLAYLVELEDAAVADWSG
jgi:hypothetical protein